MKFRKKPVVIEAFQITPERILAHLLDEDVLPREVSVSATWHRAQRKLYHFYVSIETLEGRMRADTYDWVIKGVAGEFYPCKPDIFAANKKHRQELMTAAKLALMAIGESEGPAANISEACAVAIVKAIVADKIPNISMRFTS